MATTPKLVCLGEDRSGHKLYECGPFVLRRREFDMPVSSFDYEVWHNFRVVAVVARLSDFRAWVKAPEENPIQGKKPLAELPGLY